MEEMTKLTLMSCYDLNDVYSFTCWILNKLSYDLFLLLVPDPEEQLKVK